MKSKFLRKVIALAVVGTSISTFVSYNAFALETNDFYAWQNANSGQSNGVWKLDSGKWYFYDYSGIMQTGWIYDKGKWYYADYTGVMQMGVIQIDGKIRLFSESGAMQTGNAVIGGKYYSFDENGVAVGKDIPVPINSFDLSGSTTIPYTPEIIKNEDSSPNEPNTVARDPDNLIKYNVIFKDDDGEEFSTKTIENNEKLILYKPTKIGYTFVEWTTKENGDGDSYESGDSIIIKKNITLYAQWEENGTNTGSGSGSGSGSSDNVLVEDIAITSSGESTVVGGTLNMSAKVLPIDASVKDVTWSVSDPSIASISETGVLTAKKSGKVIVVATANDATRAFGSITIEVKTVAGAAVTGLDGELQIGKTVTATASTTEPGAGTWTSSDKTVATVDPSSGVVNALKAGTTKISYTKSTSGNVNSKEITVKAVLAGAPITGLDGELQIGGKVTATAATIEPGASDWTSSDNNVATVDSNGVVNAVKAGYVVISYTKSTSGNVNFKGIKIKEADKVAGGVIEGLDGLQMGTKQIATATAKDETNVGGWRSSDKTVATIDASTGAVQALKDGYTTISYTKSDSGNVNSILVEVKKIEVTATATTLSSSTGSTTITLGRAITGLSSGDIAVKRGGTKLVKDKDYILSSDLTGTAFNVGFLTDAALDDKSVVTVEVTKAGYTINAGIAISVANTIPSLAPISIGTLTFTLSGENVNVYPPNNGTMKYIVTSKAGDIPAIKPGNKVTDAIVTNLGTVLDHGTGLNIYANNDKYVVAMEVDEYGYILAIGASAKVDVTGVVSGILFEDKDGDINQIGGVVSWKEPTDTKHITNYVIYTSTNGTTKADKLGEAAVGTKTFTMQNSIDSTGVTHIAIYTNDGTADATNGVYQKINDISTKVTLASDSVSAVADDRKITGLAQAKYVVTEGSNFYGVLADGTLSKPQVNIKAASLLAETLKGTLIGTLTVMQITGLDNYKTYKVEVAPDVAINISAIAGVTPPKTGETPVSTIIDTTEYTAIIEWTPAVSGTFIVSTVYTATITIIPKIGYTLTGVVANYFTVAGAGATNSPDLGVVTAVFPATTI